MEGLTALLNHGRKQVPITILVDRFEVQDGPIPNIVPFLRDHGRSFASGKVVFTERLNALRSGNPEQIAAWGNYYYYDLADACVTHEDKLKPQPNSPLLRGIQGVVHTADGHYVAVGAAAVSQAVKGNMKYFPVRRSETVHYGVDGMVSRPVHDVVLFAYADTDYVRLTPDQFTAVDAKALKRSAFIHGRDMDMTEIVDGKNVVHPVYRALYPDRLIAPLTHEIFAFNRREYAYDKNMGVYVTEEPQDHAELRTFRADWLDNRSRLNGNGILGNCNCRLVGVAERGAAGAAKK
ncbi:hypothetical protein HY491_01285 [Candidatus Woesearchaeota archaeon]|nr:hypothetical protein [Candidatus Woesearchaeota archaeon]